MAVKSEACKRASYDEEIALKHCPLVGTVCSGEASCYGESLGKLQP